MGLTISEIKRLQTCLTRIPSIRAGEIIQALHCEAVMEEFRKGFELTSEDIATMIDEERTQKERKSSLCRL